MPSAAVIWGCGRVKGLAVPGDALHPARVKTAGYDRLVGPDPRADIWFLQQFGGLTRERHDVGEDTGYGPQQGHDQARCVLHAGGLSRGRLTVGERVICVLMRIPGPARLGPVLAAVGLVAEGEDRRLDAVLQAEFGEDAADMGLDGLLADRQVPADLAVAVTAGDQPQDFAFAR